LRRDKELGMQSQAGSIGYLIEAVYRGMTLNSETSCCLTPTLYIVMVVRTTPLMSRSSDAHIMNLKGSASMALFDDCKVIFKRSSRSNKKPPFIRLEKMVESRRQSAKTHLWINYTKSAQRLLKIVTWASIQVSSVTATPSRTEAAIVS